MEYVDDAGISLKNLALQQFTDYDLRFYMYELMKALDYTQSMGVMHRDVKPGNIMVNHKERQLRLIDWGLAEYYIPHNKNNLKVSTRHIKGPELLIGWPYYSYSLDMWGAGCTFANLIFGKTFYKPKKGESDNKVLLLITQQLGTEGLFAYAEQYGIVINEDLKIFLGHSEKKPW